MSAAEALAPSVRDQLAEAVERLVASAGGWTPYGAVMFGVPPKVVRVWVWAKVRRQPPLPLMARAWFGKGPHGPGVTQACQAWAHALEAADARG